MWIYRKKIAIFASREEPEYIYLPSDIGTGHKINGQLGRARRITFWLANLRKWFGVKATEVFPWTSNKVRFARMQPPKSDISEKGKEVGKQSLKIYDKRIGNQMAYHSS